MVHLDVPGPDNGFFSTEEVRPRHKPALTTSRIIAFPKNHYQKPPNLAAGFSGLDLSCEKPIRANLVADSIKPSSFKITIETWADSVLHAASATWIEHKANARDCHFGQFDTRDVDAAPKGAAGTPASMTAPRKETSKEIAFHTPFREAPQVVCWLNRIDMGSGDDANYRINAYATNVTARSFVAHIDTWGDSVLNGAAMCWIAFPRNKACVASGTFSTSDVRSWSNPRPKNTARATFPKRAFAKPPTVLVALNSLDMAGNSDLRIRASADEVTSEGFRWHLDTWDDSTLYAAEASWIALGNA
ncbi:hypothetical protein BJ546DRAFT_1000012 [Cryomyces antarcticus]|nr:hypothetical protein LTR39_000136 [Cryomyces antarcticus]KAK5020263.1 hypothetical protein LTR60_000679 [Cryomyces antarcticus]KAK5149446.1 hypothetical protein LTR04_007058 [Oleoguttula sp. CCFEE 6159]